MQYIKQHLRKKILEVSLDEFDKNGFEGASMRAIAEGTGTALGNLYRYFKNKDDLYQKCLSPVLVDCIALTENVFGVSEEAIAQNARHMAKFVVEHQREFRIMLQGPAKHYNEFLERFTHCVSRQLEAHAREAGSDAYVNPGFFDAISLAFISSLRQIMENAHSEQETARYVLELMQFMFSDFDGRLKRLGGTV